jgi:hypothetical protein
MKNLFSTTSLALAAALAFSAPAKADSHIGPLTLRDITSPIVPTVARRGADRDFDGHGPIMTLGTRLFVGRGGRAVFAEVIFSAREDGGDGTATSIGPITFEVWRWRPADGQNFVARIVGDPVVTTRLPAAPGCGPIGCATIGPAEDGGLILTHQDRAGTYLRDVTYLSDTMGDDISTDNNPHGDTSIRRIRFDDITVEFTDRLVRN